MDNLKKAIRLFKKSNKVYEEMRKAEADFETIEEKLHKHLKTLTNKEFEKYIEFTN